MSSESGVDFSESFSTTAPLKTYKLFFKLKSTYNISNFSYARKVLNIFNNLRLDDENTRMKGAELLLIAQIHDFQED